MKVSIRGAGAYGPGFDSWPALADVLTGRRQYAPAATGSPKPEVIPARERRRSPLAVRLAVQVAAEACDRAGADPGRLATVFASGMGDTDITDYMCRTLVGEDKLLSPTRFHNSVHNAAAGYWSISTGCTGPANSVSAFDLTVPVALLEAATQAVLEHRPVLAVWFDVATPPAMRDILPIDSPFAAALVLSPDDAGTVIDIESLEQCAEWPALDRAPLSGVYQDNPAARVLVLLERLAGGRAEAVTLPLGAGRSLSVRFTG